MDEAIRAFVEAVSMVEDPRVVAGLLAGFATNREYFEPLIAPMDPDQMGGAALHVPDEGPRLFLMHRPKGVMSYVHSHGTWAVVAPIAGVETHRAYRVEGEAANGRARLRVAQELPLTPGASAFVVPPYDIHSHGHAGGEDDSPFTLILTGEDQTKFARREYDLDAGTYRDLPPGDLGTLNLPPVS
jgi:predicted metal-dependent enzyme (double-stranded beta helix superfamily)